MLKWTVFVIGFLTGCDLLEPTGPTPATSPDLARAVAVAEVTLATLTALPEAPPNPDPAPETDERGALGTPIGTAPPPEFEDPGVEDAPPAPPEFVGEIRSRAKTRTTAKGFFPAPSPYSPAPPTPEPYSGVDAEIVTVAGEACVNGSCGMTRSAGKGWTRRGLFGRWRRR